ncbi:MAG TPA: AI-2E family transporter, partial [Kofleriaceae bacterium]|nr:AI-2E family transporter [Kofleriaceae bacterium]
MTASLQGSRDVASWLRLGILAAFAWMVAPIATPVLLGIITAVVLEPTRHRLSGRVGRRAAATMLTVLFVLFVVGVIVVVGGRLAVGFDRLASRDWQATVEGLRTYSDDGALPKLLGVGGGELRAAAADVFQSLAHGVASMAGQAVMALPGWIISLFLYAAALYFTLRDGEQMLGWAVARSPFTDPDTRSLLSELRTTIHGVVLGLFATSLVQGALTLAALLVLDVPGAFALAAIATLLSFVPLLGTTPVTIGAVVYLAGTGHDGAAVAMAGAAIIIGLADNVV